MSIIQISHLSYLWEYIIYLCYAKNSELLVMSNNCEISINYIPIIQYLNMLAVQVSNIERPPEYESAIRSKERAREDIQVRMLNAALFGLDTTFNTWINKYELTKWGELIQMVIIFTWPSSCDLIWEILCVCCFFFVRVHAYWLVMQ